nr:MAG TPA: hypothetical protein [Caudoviricetes sp.]DAO94338.1 MAG TPA: hypothetical protein [Caudoviricetes sp.]
MCLYTIIVYVSIFLIYSYFSYPLPEADPGTPPLSRPKTSYCYFY